MSYQRKRSYGLPIKRLLFVGGAIAVSAWRLTVAIKSEPEVEVVSKKKS